VIRGARLGFLLLPALAAAPIRPAPPAPEAQAAREAPPPGGRRHPALIDPASAKCGDCHAEILRGEVRHAPAEEGCLSCHEFSKKERQTLVTLAATGPALCVSCHADFEKFAEGKVAAPHAPVTDSCGHCHNSHSSEHGHLLTTTAQALCLSCHPGAGLDLSHPLPVSRSSCLECHGPHGTDFKKMLTGGVVHAPFAEGSCDSCHRKGRGTRVRPRAAKAALCYACHTDLETAFGRGSVHTIVREGRCTDCHSPHLAASAKLLKATGKELCFRCHPNIRAKASAAGAHAPAKAGCATCHEPHRSDHAGQLKAPPPGLCLGCHSPKGGALARKHLGADLAKTACLTCHDPHGSAQKHLLATGSVHAPFADGSCDTCHLGGQSGALVEKGGKALCTSCHADVEEASKKAKVPHAALEGECTACHTPHASNQPKLLKGPTAAVCTACHEGQAPKAGEMPHGVIAWLGCQSCHLPHGGEQAKLLRVPGNDLCNGCHLSGTVKPDPAGVIKLPGGFSLTGEKARRLRVVDLDTARKKNHPILNHPVTGKPSGTGRAGAAKQIGEMSCLSCHVPHNAKSPELFAYSAGSRLELCSACHPK